MLTVTAIACATFVALGVRFGPVSELPAYCVLAAGMVVAAATDIDHYRIPKRIVYATLSVGAPLLVLASADGSRWHQLTTAVLGGAIAFALFACLHLVSPKGMGFGDVRLAGLAGVFLGWLGPAQVAIGLFLAFLIGSLTGLVLVLFWRWSPRSKLPFAPFLAAGTLLAVLFGDSVRRLWLG